MVGQGFGAQIKGAPQHDRYDDHGAGPMCSHAGQGLLRIEPAA